MPQEIWQKIDKAIDKMAEGDNLEGWDLAGIKTLLKQIKEHIKDEEKKQPDKGKKKTPKRSR